MYSASKFFSVLLITILLYSCANIVTPQGGPKDTQPPKIVYTEPHDSTINFTEKKIIIRFNENILLPNGAQGFTISPLLNQPLEAENNRKQLTFTLKDLQPNTTYTIIGDKAITDNTEFNKVPAFQYIFSTGDHLDTNQISGFIYNSENNKPVPNITVAIQRFDSVISKQYKSLGKPQYYSKTDESGSYTITGISKGSYFIYCFNDDNKNMLHETGEAFGFNNKPVIIDTGNASANLFLYPTIKTIQKGITAITTVQNGYYQVQFDPSYSIKRISQTDISNDKKSSLYVCLADSCSSPFNYNLFTSLNTGDSVHFTSETGKGNISFAIPVSKIPSKLNVINAATNAKRETLIRFNRPLDATDFNASRIIVNQYKDTIKAQITISDPFTLKVSGIESGYYTLKIPSNTIHDIFGNYADSGVFPIQVFSESQLASITFKPHTRTTQNILQVTGMNYCSQFTLIDTNTINCAGLIPGKYIIRVFQDLNSNHYRDDGNFTEQILPEKLLYYKEIEVKPSIEYEEEMYLMD